MIDKIVEIISNEVGKLAKASQEIKEKVFNLDKPLNSTYSDVENVNVKNKNSKNNLNELDKPLKTENLTENSGKSLDEGKESTRIDNPEKKMEPQIVIKFTCPEGMDRTEMLRQLKGQERGLNSQSIAENMDNRKAFEQRKAETGNGRDLGEGKKAQEIARQKAIQSRIESNQKKGMSYSEAKDEASEWIKTQAALHNPDQIAGGEPSKVSRMGDANVNSSIGSQWRSRVQQLADSVEDYAKDRSRDELENTKMNVKLVLE